MLPLTFSDLRPHHMSALERQHEIEHDEIDLVAVQASSPAPPTKCRTSRSCGGNRSARSNSPCSADEVLNKTDAWKAVLIERGCRDV